MGERDPVVFRRARRKGSVRARDRGSIAGPRPGACANEDEDERRGAQRFRRTPNSNGLHVALARTKTRAQQPPPLPPLPPPRRCRCRAFRPCPPARAPRAPLQHLKEKRGDEHDDPREKDAAVLRANYRARPRAEVIVALDEHLRLVTITAAPDEGKGRDGSGGRRRGARP